MDRSGPSCPGRDPRIRVGSARAGRRIAIPETRDLDEWHKYTQIVACSILMGSEPAPCREVGVRTSGQQQTMGQVGGRDFRLGAQAGRDDMLLRSMLQVQAHAVLCALGHEPFVSESDSFARIPDRPRLGGSPRSPAQKAPSAGAPSTGIPGATKCLAADRRSGHFVHTGIASEAADRRAGAEFPLDRAHGTQPGRKGARRWRGRTRRDLGSILADTVPLALFMAGCHNPGPHSSERHAIACPGASAHPGSNVA